MSRLDEASFAAAWEAGARLSLDEAAELALTSTKPASGGPVEQLVAETRELDRRRSP